MFFVLFHQQNYIPFAILYHLHMYSSVYLYEGLDGVYWLENNGHF